MKLLASLKSIIVPCVRNSLMLNSFCNITLVWQPWTMVLAQFAKSRCVSTLRWWVTTPSEVPHRTLNVIRSDWRDELTNLWETNTSNISCYYSNTGKVGEFRYRVAINGHNSTGALHASGLHGADSYNRNSRSVTAPNTDCHLSLFSSPLSELVLPFYRERMKYWLWKRYVPWIITSENLI